MEDRVKNYKKCNGHRRIFMLDDFKIWKELDIAFPSYMGMARVVKQAALKSMQDYIVKSWPTLKPLEISSLSDVEIGSSLSAMNLHLDGHILESVFQSSKVFKGGKSHPEVIDLPGREARSIVNMESGSDLIGFNYDGVMFPLEPRSYFYDYIYIKSLLQSNLNLDELLNYNVFSDFFYNDKKQYNTQARSVAIYVGLRKMNLLDKAMENPESFKKIVYDKKF